MDILELLSLRDYPITCFHSIRDPLDGHDPDCESPRRGVNGEEKGLELKLRNG